MVIDDGIAELPEWHQLLAEVQAFRTFHGFANPPGATPDEIALMRAQARAAQLYVDAEYVAILAFQNGYDDDGFLLFAATGPRGFVAANQSVSGRAPGVAHFGREDAADLVRSPDGRYRRILAGESLEAHDSFASLFCALLRGHVASIRQIEAERFAASDS